MTYEEAEYNFGLLIDKANAAPFDALQVQAFLSLAIDEAATEWMKSAEANNEFTSRLSGVLRPYTIPSSTSIINTTTVATTVSGIYWRTAAMQMSFTVPFGSGTQNITRAVTPCKIDELYSRRQDTLRQDTPYNPFYTESNTSGDIILTVYSGGVDNTDGELMFYKIPNSADLNSPSAPLTDLSDETHQSIVYRAARMALESIGDPKYSTFINEYKLNQ